MTTYSHSTRVNPRLRYFSFLCIEPIGIGGLYFIDNCYVTMFVELFCMELTWWIDVLLLKFKSLCQPCLRLKAYVSFLNTY